MTENSRCTDQIARVISLLYILFSSICPKVVFVGPSSFLIPNEKKQSGNGIFISLMFSICLVM